MVDNQFGHCDLDLEDSKPLHMTQSWPMMMYHHTKSGLKGSSENTIQRNIC